MTIFCAYKPHSNQFAYPYVKALGATVPRRHSLAETYALAASHSVLWLEWANDFAAEVLRNKPPAFTVVRVHDHEIRQGRVDKINWSNVDLIWFINPDAMRDFERRLPGVTTERFFLPNAVDPSQFELAYEDTKRLAFLSLLPRPRKRLDRAIRLASMLPEYTLHIRTSPALNGYGCDAPKEIAGMQQYAEEMGVEVEWDLSFPDLSKLDDKTEVVEFFRGKSHVISTSEHEGFHYAVAEGALCGLVPVVYDWEWGSARTFWDAHMSLESMAEYIRNTRPGPGCRDIVERNYGADVLAGKLTEILESHVRRKAA